jgi:hypothetical protein
MCVCVGGGKEIGVMGRWVMGRWKGVVRGEEKVSEKAI